MIANVPTWLRELSAWVGAIVVVVGGITAIFSRKPFKWLGRKLVSEPFGSWVRRQIETSKTGKSVQHHLGPNGDTVPLHSRVAKLEGQAVISQWLADINDEDDETILEED